MTDHANLRVLSRGGRNYTDRDRIYAERLQPASRPPRSTTTNATRRCGDGPTPLPSSIARSRLQPATVQVRVDVNSWPGAVVARPESTVSCVGLPCCRPSSIGPFQVVCFRRAGRLCYHSPPPPWRPQYHAKASPNAPISTSKPSSTQLIHIFSASIGTIRCVVPGGTGWDEDRTTHHSPTEGQFQGLRSTGALK